MSLPRTSPSRTSSAGTSSARTCCPHRDTHRRTSCPKQTSPRRDVSTGTSFQGHHVPVRTSGMSPSRTGMSSAGTLCPHRDVLKGDVLDGDIMSSTGTFPPRTSSTGTSTSDIRFTQGRPRRGHLCPFLLLPLCSSGFCITVDLTIYLSYVN